MYKVIIFDLWNTLAEFIGLDELEHEVQKSLGDRRFKLLSDEFAAWHKENTSPDYFLDNLKEKLALSQDEADSIMRFIDIHSYKKYPETEEVLKKLKSEDYTLVLLSNSPPPAKKQSRSLGLPKYFDRLVFSFEIGYMKPDKKAFRLAVENLDVDTDEVLMVGDSLEADIKGAEAVGFDAILLDRDDSRQYQEKITNLKDLFVAIQ